MFLTHLILTCPATKVHQQVMKYDQSWIHGNSFFFLTERDPSPVIHALAYFHSALFPFTKKTVIPDVLSIGQQVLPNPCCMPEHYQHKHGLIVGYVPCPRSEQGFAYQVEVPSQYSRYRKIFNITPSNITQFVFVAYTWNNSYYCYAVERSKLKNLFLHERPGCNPIMVFKNWHEYNRHRQQIENQGQDNQGQDKQKSCFPVVIALSITLILFVMLIAYLRMLVANS